MIVMRSYLTEKQRNVPVLFGKTEVLRGENAAMFSLGPFRDSQSVDLDKIIIKLVKMTISKYATGNEESFI
jgi:hypothetical protein